MNDSMSILLATTVLALGGLGLYMFKSSDDNQIGGDEEYNEDGLFSSDSLFGSGKATFGSSSLFNWMSDDNIDDEDKLEEFEEEEYKPRKRGPKTLKNRKSTGNSRRRY
jgi:hypothetical protein